MNLSFKDFKKVAQDEKMTTLKHAKGHVIQIAHHALSKKMRDELHSIESDEPKKMADGGMADEGDSYSDESSPEQTAPVVNNYYSQPQEPIQGIPSTQAATPMAASNFGATVAPQVPSVVPVEPPPPAPAVAPMQEQPMADVLQDGVVIPPSGGLALQKRGIAEEAQAQADLGNQQARDIQSAQREHEKLAADTQAGIDQFKAEDSKSLAEYKAGEIKSNHYWDSLTTAGKAATVLGLVLGGIGAGMTHTENQALKLFNSEIDRDIDAQKANLGKKQNLLEYNYRRFGNMKDAQAVTAAQMQQKLSLDLQAASAKSNDPMAKARADQLAGKLQSEYDAKVAPIYQKQALLKSLRGKDASNVDPSRLVALLVPPEHQKQVYTEIGQAQHATRAKNELMSAFDEAAKENTILRTAGGLRTPVSISTLNALSLPLIHDAEGRVNEFEQKTLQDLYPKGGDLKGKIDGKRRALEAFIEQKRAAPTAKGNGIDLTKFNSTNYETIPESPPKK